MSRERPTIEVLSHQIRLAHGRPAGCVHGDDVRMSRKAGDGVGLPPEISPDLGVLDVAAQHLDGNLTIESFLSRQIDNGGTSSTQGAQNGVAGQNGRGGAGRNRARATVRTEHRRGRHFRAAVRTARDGLASALRHHTALPVAGRRRTPGGPGSPASVDTSALIVGHVTDAQAAPHSDCETLSTDVRKLRHHLPPAEGLDEAERACRITPIRASATPYRHLRRRLSAPWARRCSGGCDLTARLANGEHGPDAGHTDTSMSSTITLWSSDRELAWTSADSSKNRAARMAPASSRDDSSRTNGSPAF